MNKSIFFIFACISHLSIILLSLSKLKNNEKLVYILGHLLICSTMLMRISESMRGHIATSIIGSIGHTLLFVYFISEIFIRKNIPINSFPYYLTISCIIAQIGMIIVYWYEYIEEENIELTQPLENFMTINKYIALVLLAIFYYFNGIISNHTTTMIPNIFMTATYLMAIYLFRLETH